MLGLLRRVEIAHPSLTRAMSGTRYIGYEKQSFLVDKKNLYGVCVLINVVAWFLFFTRAATWLVSLREHDKILALLRHVFRCHAKQLSCFSSK